VPVLAGPAHADRDKGRLHNVIGKLHGRKSISWAKSVLPLFTGASSETLRKVPDRVQIDTTLKPQNYV
jgi:hypothetical protein